MKTNDHLLLENIYGKIVENNNPVNVSEISYEIYQQLINFIEKKAISIVLGDSEENSQIDDDAVSDIENAILRDIYKRLSRNIL